MVRAVGLPFLGSWEQFADTQAPHAAPWGRGGGLVGRRGCGPPLEGTLWGGACVGGSSSPSLRRRGRGQGGCSGQVVCLLSCETSTELSGGWEKVGEERVGRLGDMRAERKRVSPGPCMSLSVAGLWDQGQGDSPLPRMTLRPGSVSTDALGGCRGTQHHPWAEGESEEWCWVDASENYPEGKLQMSFSSGRACGLSYKSQVNYQVSE